MKLNNKVVLILAGVGSVGSEVLNILIKQTSNFSLIGILNSKNMIYNKEGIYNKDALNQLIKKGTKSIDFLKYMQKKS